MSVIVRKHYLEKLQEYKDTEFIKVITGVRRCGKSCLLEILHTSLLENEVKDTQIFYLSFEGMKYDHLKKRKVLYNYITKNAPKNKKVYFLFDEIQEVSEWQLLVNSLRLDFDSDIYITGSNASILSGELATYLSGRYVEIRVYPLSFQEFLDFKGNVTFKNIQAYYNEYREFGGFPAVVLQPNNETKVDVLSGILDSILIRDVSLRDQKIDVSLLVKLTEYLFDIVGNIFSAKKVLGTLKNEQLSSSVVTINNYLNWLTQSFLFYKAMRFDIRGKERLRTLGKYYTVDLGLRNQALQDSEQNRGFQLENMVYLELLRRGFQIFVGKYDVKEIDFVARKRDETIYIQVTAEIPKTSTRETDHLLYLPTGYAKKIIVENYNDVGIVEGIPVVHILDFLLEGYSEKENLI